MLKLAHFARLVVITTMVSGPAWAAAGSTGQAPAAYGAAVVPDPLTPSQLRATVERLQYAFAQALVLRPELKIDPDLRARLNAMTATLLRRTPDVFAAWVEEIRVDVPPAHADAELQLRLQNRFQNELSLWWFEPSDTAWTDAMWPAWTKPLVCAEMDDWNGFGREALWLQALPLDQREAALLGEEALMVRWGRPRPALPPPPEHTVAEEEAEWIAALRAGHSVTTRALPPVLAANFLSLEPPSHPSARLRCALHQWWLAESLSRPNVDRAAVLARWHDELTPRLADWTGEKALYGSSSQAPGDYPFIATRLGIEGRVRVSSEIDAQGRVVSSRIVSRELSVPGISGRPVCCERLLDEASIVRAANRAAVPPSADALVNGRARRETVVNWKLE